MKIKLTHLFLSCFLLFTCVNAEAQIFDDADDLADAVNESTDGGIFIVKDGTYNDFEASFEIIATEGSPVLIKAESVGGVILTGESHFVLKKSAHVVVEGFVFDGKGEDTLIKLEGCNNIRITKNIFELETSESIKWVFIGGVWDDNTYPFNYPSHHNRIDHNTFQNKETPGHYITVDGTFDDTGSDEVYYQSQYDRIDHNYFKNNGPRATNEQESIRIGWSEMSESSGYTIVEHNLFEDCDGDPEIVSVKSCDNTVRHNTFVGCYGTLSLRHGNRNRVEGNYFFGNDKPISTSPDGATLYTGGIRIYGTDHVIINNYMEGLTGTRWDAPITLTQGDAVDGESSNLSKHFRAERVMIAYNTLVNNSHGIEIGFDNNNNYNKDLEDITIAYNLITGSENSLVDIVEPGNDQGDNITWVNNLMYPTENAIVLNGGTTTAFDNTESINENPNLEWDGSLNIWRATQGSPLYENVLSQLLIIEDIDGQMRPSTSNLGADHYSLETVRFKPLIPGNVGPDGDQDAVSTSVHDIKGQTISLFPVPADEMLYIDNSNTALTLVQLYDMNGSLLLSQNVESQLQYLSVNTSSITNGMYVVKLSENEGRVSTQNIIIKH